MKTKQCTYARRGPDGLAQIGLSRFDVAGVRFFDGENGAAGAGGEGAGANGGDGGQNGQQNNGPKPPWGDDKSKFDPDKAWALIQNVKGDLAAEKQKRDEAIATAVAKATADAQKNTLAEFAKLLAGEKEPETDPVKLAATIAEKDTALTAAQTAILDAQRTAQAAIHGVALGANITALLADPTFKTSLASVDPTKEADVKSAITQALQANAALKQPPARSGDVEPTGPTVQSLEAQLKAAEEKKDVSETIRLKRALVFARTAQKA